MAPLPVASLAGTGWHALYHFSFFFLALLVGERKLTEPFLF